MWVVCTSWWGTNVSRSKSHVSVSSSNVFEMCKRAIEFCCSIVQFCSPIESADAQRPDYERVFAKWKGYDVNLFGIVDEGVLENGCQYNLLYGKGVRCGSNVVASMLHHFLSNIIREVGHAKLLHLHSDLCSRQKNNIVLGYFMCRVGHGYHDKLVWHFMSVVHTKFRPEVGSGCILRHVWQRIDILSMHDSVISSSERSNFCVRFPINKSTSQKFVQYLSQLSALRGSFRTRLRLVLIWKTESAGFAYIPVSS